MNAFIRQARGFAVALMLIFSLPAFAGPVDDSIRAKLEPAAGKRVLRVANAAIPQAVVEFYAQRQWQPVWDQARYQALLTALADTYNDGLNPEDYSYSLLARLPRADDSQAAAERDMLATRACLLALLHLYHGKVEPQSLDSHWNFDARQLDPEQGLARVREAVESGDIAGIFASARPAAPQYGALRAALARLRTVEQNGGWPVLSDGPALKPGASDARVPLLRQRLQVVGLLPGGAAGQATDNAPNLPANIEPLPGEQNAQAQVYDPALVQAVQRFQRESYLDADGVVGAQTLAALNVPVRQRIDQVRVNLERARWLLHELKDDFVIVDIAGYRIAYMHDGKAQWRSRVQIGKEYRATPIFKSVITHITLSPSWVVPPTIFRQDSLPAIRRDAAYLTRNRLRVYDAAGREIPASSVDWSRPGNITLRQDPGPTGSLGEMAIRFPNDYAIYLHDTPHQALFGGSQRATSSGCIRVENIHELAVLLLDDPENWNRQAMQQVIDERKPRNVTLKTPVPILLAYWTVDIGDDGHVSFKPDVYKQDAGVLAGLDKAA